MVLNWLFLRENSNQKLTSEVLLSIKQNSKHIEKGKKEKKKSAEKKEERNRRYESSTEKNYQHLLIPSHPIPKPAITLSPKLFLSNYFLVSSKWIGKAFVFVKYFIILLLKPPCFWQKLSFCSHVDSIFFTFWSSFNILKRKILISLEVSAYSLQDGIKWFK